MVLIKLLSSNDHQVLLRTVQVLAHDADSGLFAQHVDTLLPVLLRLSSYTTSMVSNTTNINYDRAGIVD